MTAGGAVGGGGVANRTLPPARSGTCREMLGRGGRGPSDIDQLRGPGTGADAVRSKVGGCVAGVGAIFGGSVGAGG